MNEIKYISFEEALNVYKKTIEKSGGGFQTFAIRVVLKAFLSLFKMICIIPTLFRN